MREKLLKEPVAVGALIRAILLAFMAFGVTITPEQMGAVMLVVELALALFTRATSVAVISLPPGVAGDMANRKAAEAAGR